MILETTRLRLREMTRDDLDFVAEMLADLDVMRFYPRPLDREGAIAWVQRQLDRYEGHGCGLWLAVDKATNEPVGQVGLTPPRGLPNADDVELGYLIHRPYWRRGFAFEAASACRDHAFEKMGRDRMICLVRPVNLPSMGVARKVGLLDTGLRTELLGFDHVVFAQTRDDRP